MANDAYAVQQSNGMWLIAMPATFGSGGIPPLLFGTARVAETVRRGLPDDVRAVAQIVVIEWEPAEVIGHSMVVIPLQPAAA